MSEKFIDSAGKNYRPGYLMQMTSNVQRDFTGDLLKMGMPDAPAVKSSAFQGQLLQNTCIDIAKPIVMFPNIYGRMDHAPIDAADTTKSMTDTSVECVDGVGAEELAYFEKMEPKPAAMVFSYLKKTSNVIVLDGVPHLYERNLGIYSAITVSASQMLMVNLPGVIEDKVLCSNMGDVAKRFNAHKRQFPQMTWLKNPQVERYIKFKNGVFDLQEGRIVETDNSQMESFFLTHEINAEYPEGGGECPLFDHFLATSFAGVEDQIPLVWAMIGLAISNIRSLKKAFFLYGANDSGKSALCSVLTGLVGADYTSALRVEDFGEKFDSSVLIGKYLNVGAEMSSGVLKNIPEFKAFISGGTDLLDFKVKYKGSRMQVNTALMVFPMNDLPTLPTDQNTGSIFSRIQIIAMPNTIPESDRIPDLEFKLKREYGAIAFKAVKMLQTVIENGAVKLPVCDSSKAAMLQYQLHTRELGICESFIDEFLDYRPEAVTASDDLYSAFEAFCKKYGVPYKKPASWGKTLQQYWGKPLLPDKVSINGYRNRCAWMGVAFKEHNSIKEESEECLGA